MKLQKLPVRPQTRFRSGAVAIAIGALFGMNSSHAFRLDTGPDSDWKMNFDNTVQYIHGVRMGDADTSISSNPTYTETDLRFPHKGDMVTSRLSLMSEFDAVYQSRYGVRLSAALWKDFAYDDNAGPAATSNYFNGKYSDYTKRWQVEGAELREAFVFANFDLGERPSNIKLGRLTEYWGNSLFFSGAGVAYSQSGTDVIKAVAVPGTQAKELSLPRGQISFSTQLADNLQFGAQYFVEAAQDRYPSGGTYFGLADFVAEGPDRAVAFGPFNTRLASVKPNDVNDNFGLQLKWSPQWVNGTLGFYYRQFDETSPAGPFLGVNVVAVIPGAPPTPVIAPTGYLFAYPEKTKLLGLSLDKQVMGASVGVEVTYRENTALSTSPNLSGAFGAPNADLGARGDTLNMVVNMVSVLDSTPLYNTGTLVAELGMVKKLNVTKNEANYAGEGTAACLADAAGVGAAAQAGVKTGCATDTAFVIAGLFEPQWLQAFPGVDLSLPTYAMYGLSGNVASNGITVKEGDLMYSVGIKAVVDARYNFTLQYNGFNGNSVEVATPGGPVSVAGGNLYQFKDRNWLSFAFSTTF